MLPMVVDWRCVCVRVGGINTVLRTKAAVSIDEMGDQYCMVGPYVEKGVKMEIEVEEPIKFQPMAAVVNKMKEYGFRVRSTSILLLIADDLWCGQRCIYSS